MGDTGLKPLLLGASEPAVAASEKYRLHAETGCAAVDLESGAVAEIARLRGLPFAALRAICDPADFSLPPASLVGLTGTGEINVWPVIASLLRQPAQLPALIHLARAAAAARRALAKACGSQLPLRPRGRRGSG